MNLTQIGVFEYQKIKLQEIAERLSDKIGHQVMYPEVIGYLIQLYVEHVPIIEEDCDDK